MQELIKSVIQRIAVGPDRSKDITPEEAEQVVGAILAGEVDEVQAAVILIALRMKRETLAEFRGLALGVQKNVAQVNIPVKQLFQLADPYDGYLRHLPMSPFLPAVLATFGLHTVMCGVETVGPKHGITSHKVYKLAGINADLTTQQAAQQITEIGWSYLDQSRYCPKLMALASLRNRIVKRTALTTLERVLMPIQAQQQTNLVLGYVHKAYPEIYADISKALGFSSALLVKGLEGGLTPAVNKPLRKYCIDFYDTKGVQIVEQRSVEKEVVDSLSLFDAPQAGHIAEKQQAEDVQKNVKDTLQLGLGVLSGEQGVARDSLCLSAANILQSYQVVSGLDEAVEKVRNCLDNGVAQQKFKQAVTIS